MKNYCNMDPKTGYYYGVISLNSVDPEAIYECGHTKSWAEIFNNRVDTLRKKIDEMFEQHDEKLMNDLYPSFVDLAKNIEREVIKVRANDGEENREDILIYDDGQGLHCIIYQDSNTMMVTQSPYSTSCRPCSPCYPNAGDLNSPCGGLPDTYCLPDEFFDKDTGCPYVIYKVIP